MPGPQTKVAAVRDIGPVPEDVTAPNAWYWTALLGVAPGLGQTMGALPDLSLPRGSAPMYNAATMGGKPIAVPPPVGAQGLASGPEPVIVTTTVFSSAGMLNEPFFTATSNQIT